MFANAGPSGEPITTTSICRCMLKLSMLRQIVNASTNRRRSYGLFNNTSNYLSFSSGNHINVTILTGFIEGVHKFQRNHGKSH